jgi:hypothetical protein
MTEQPAPTISLPIKFPRHTVDKLRSEAQRRGLRADELAAEILMNVTAHDLFLAVLDY